MLNLVLHVVFNYLKRADSLLHFQTQAKGDTSQDFHWMFYSKDAFAFYIKDFCGMKFFLQGLSNTYSTGSCNEKCQLSRQHFCSYFQPQSAQQNAAYYFLESTPWILLSAPSNENPSSAEPHDFSM